MVEAITNAVQVFAQKPALALALPDSMAFDEWVAVGRNLCLGRQALNWHIGDWWAFGDHRYGDRAKAVAEGIFGREYVTLANSATVASRFDLSRRRDTLSFTHHAEVVALPQEEADALLERAELERLSTRDLRREVHALRSDDTQSIIPRRAGNASPPSAQLLSAFQMVAWFADQLKVHRPLTESEQAMEDVARSFLVPRASYRLSGKATAKFAQPVRIAARWAPSEVEIVRLAVECGREVHEAAALLPYRSYHSVKDIYYRESDPQDRDDPASLSDARRQKDAIEGSAKLYQAIVAAGLWVPLEIKKAG